LKNLTLTVPRKEGWWVIWAVFRVTLQAYLNRDRSITFTFGGDE
jgi:hypothetical protein